MTREGRRGVALTFTFDVGPATSDERLSAFALVALAALESVALPLELDVDRLLYTLDAESPAGRRVTIDEGEPGAVPSFAVLGDLSGAPYETHSSGLRHELGGRCRRCAHTFGMHEKHSEACEFLGCRCEEYVGDGADA